MKKTVFIFSVFILPFFAEAEIHPLSLAGDNLFSQNNFDSALICYNQLLQEFPEKKECYFNRGLCLYKQEKFSEAILDFDECLTLDSTFLTAEFLKGISLEKSGSLKEAMAAFTLVSTKDATIFDAAKRIKNYELAVFISKNWNLMIAMAVILILLVALATNVLSSKKM